MPALALLLMHPMVILWHVIGSGDSVSSLPHNPCLRSRASLSMIVVTHVQRHAPAVAPAVAAA